ncbi:uncharacterized protein LOC135829201 [Sycon ciliatum]|uniref:uncharacterized protein LOC135829201 n=1 Tax=Sycon ciliatum TaxID=27933 RepID=UPI0031F66C56
MTATRPPRFVYVYLHGLFSGPHSHKALALGEYFRQQPWRGQAAGTHLHIPSLNHADATPMNVTEALHALHGFYMGQNTKLPTPASHQTGHSGAERVTNVKLRIVGSSYGGYLAARFAQVHGGCVDSLILLCPAFKLHVRLRQMIRDKDWELLEQNQYRMPTRTRPVGAAASASGWYSAVLPRSFIEDFEQQPVFPVPACTTYIIHGSRDDVILPRWVMQYADEHKKRFGLLDGDNAGHSRQRFQLEMVDDVHDLTAASTLDKIRSVISDVWAG